ncbi:MFS transporter [uncultured Succinivibrio sp.]|uniref:MFS transporter n=1 Tax=uncultured Succinivibrio sp. TaxID=540749 RepID=UPI0025DCDF7B|nr:MFS transporter [uncultured Succinivibrio sp.]
MPFFRFLILAVCINSFCGSFMGSSIFIAIPALSSDFHVPPEYITAVINAYVIAVTAFLVPTIAIVQRIGHKRGFVIGSVVSAITSVLIALSPNFYSLIAFRTLQGLSNAFIFSTTYALLIDNIDSKSKGSAIGMTTACVYAGISCAPFLGGFLTDTIGWWSMFIISACGNFSAALLCRNIPTDNPEPHKLAYLKGILSLIGFVTFFTGLSMFINNHDGLYLLAAGIVLLTFYVYRELTSKNPLLKLSVVLENRILNGSLLSSMFHYLSTFAITMLLSMHLQLINGYTASMAGIILVIQPVVQCLVSPFAGKAADRFSPHLISFIGLLISGSSLCILSFIEPKTPFYMIALAQFLSGLGFGLFSAPNSTIIMSSVPREYYAMGSGLQALVRNSGMAFCMAMVTSVLFYAINSEEGTTLYIRELSAAMQIIFTLSAILTLISALFLLISFRALKQKA